MKLTSIAPTAAFALIAASLFAGAAHAVVISTPGTTPAFIDTANGTPPSSIAFGAAMTTLAGTSSGTFTQGLQFVSGYDGAGGPIPFTVDEMITIGSVTETVAIDGVMDVSSTTAPDSITITGGSPVDFGLYAVSVTGQTFLDNPPYPGGILNITQGFDVAYVPEPAALGIMGFALLGLAAFRRRA